MESLEEGKHVFRWPLRDIWTNHSVLRHIQGLFGGSTYYLIFKWFNFVFSLAALATAGLGKLSAIRHGMYY
jgi:hypothetical protein